MPTITQQPALTATSLPYLAGWGQCQSICLNITDMLINSGQKANITLTITATNIAAGTTFIIAGQQFTVSTTVPQPINTVNLTTGTALQKADRIKLMLDSNPYISQNFNVTSPVAVGVNYQVQLQAKLFGIIDTTTLLPAPNTDIEIPGAKQQLLYDKLAYRVYINNTQVNLPFSTYSIAFNAQGIPSTVCPEFNVFSQPTLNTTFPLTQSQKTSPYCDNTIRRKVKVEFFGIKVSGCQQVGVPDIVRSNEWYSINAAVQEEDRFFVEPSVVSFPFIPHYYPTSIGQMRMPLTRRKEFCTRKDNYDWLWLIVDDRERFGVAGTLTYQVIPFTNLGFMPTAVIATMINTNCVVVLPSGMGNTWNLNNIAGLKSYNLQVLLDGNLIMDVKYTVEPPCCDIELYHLNDFGGYDSTDWCLSETAINIELDAPCVGTPCYNTNSDETVNYSNRLGLGGKKVISADAARKYTIKRYIDIADQNGMLIYEEIIKSPIHFFKYVRAENAFDTGVFMRNVFIESGSYASQIVEDGKMEVSLNLIAHKDQNIQI